VLALDGQAAAELAGVAQVTLGGSRDRPVLGLDAIVGPQAPEPEALAALGRQLRPGGRLIVTHTAPLEVLLAALMAAGFVHCLAEPCGAANLYRGERPPEGSSRERLQTLSASADAALNVGPANLRAPAALALTITDRQSLTGPYLFLLITQTPNKPAWKLGPGERLAWRAHTALHPSNAAPVLLAFSSLVKAVAFMQSAILARAVAGVNKVGKFPASAAQAWAAPLTLNPDFETVRHLKPGPPFEVDPGAAVTGEE
jgi:hypothetical protein